MRLLRYPLQPLTEAGCVLACIAAALFAALLLIAWTEVPDDDLELVPAPPLVTLTSAASAR